MTILLEAPATRIARPLAGLSVGDLQRELTQLQARLVGCVRGLLFLLALLPFGIQIGLVSNIRMLALTLALIGLTLALTIVQRLPTRMGFALDVLAVALLVQSTGGAHSPYLCVSLALIVQGAAIGGRRDALAGGGFGIVLLLFTAAESAYPAVLVIVFAALHMISAITVAWVCTVGAAALKLLHQEGKPRAASASITVDWDTVTIALAGCAKQTELARVAGEQAQRLARVTARVTFGSSTTARSVASDDAAVAMPFAHGESCGLLTLGCAASALTNEQHRALRRLAALIGVYAALLDITAQVQCQQDIMTTLWQVADFLRVAPQFDTALLETSRHMVRALHLDWLMLLAPDERHALAPLLSASNDNSRNPILAGKSLQYALETLHTGNPQVRDEHGHTLMYLPLHPMTGSPLVLVARTLHTTDSTQIALMLFGSLVADSLVTRNPATPVATETVHLAHARV